LREEIGYQAGVLKRIGYIYPAPGYTTERIVIYEARKLKKVEARAEADEIISLRPFSRRELGRLLRRGRIVDAKTICALKLAGVV
jgi:ADP-ribose pyrophosphatase